jgi:hypothetical protein
MEPLTARSSETSAGFSPPSVDFHTTEASQQQPVQQSTPSQQEPLRSRQQQQPPQPKKFLNGWTKEIEDLMADWADKALVYKWLHESTSTKYKKNDQNLIIPVIVLSTLTGTANFGMGSFFGSDSAAQRFAQLAIGGVSIAAGILSTLVKFYEYAKCAETHRTSAVAWGKFNRLLSIELSLHPDERLDSKAFIKMFRIELDRLIEQAPIIPDPIIEKFKILFEDSNIRLPDILGVMEHTKVYADTNARFKKVVAEATLMIQQKKGMLKEMVLNDLDKKIRDIVDERIYHAKIEPVPDKYASLNNELNEVVLKVD